jgi:non-ribosomal peptide synthetase component F
VLFDHRSDLLRSLAFGPACHARVLDETLVHTRTAKTDLLLVTESVDGELSAAVEYDTALFEAQSMRRLLARFEVLLSAALEEPACPIGALPLATADDAAEALALRGTSWPLEHASVLAAFRAQVARAPDAIALEHGDLQVSYAELAERAERLAARLFALGVGRGQRVALLAERSPLLVVAHLAILRVGAAYVPLDPTHPLERWRFTLADSRASLVLVDDAHRTALPEGPRALVLADENDTELDPAPEPATRADDPAYVMYTSGSTGRPKGVLVAQRGILRLVLDARWARLGRLLFSHLKPI